jgi:hypothetical protein
MRWKAILVGGLFMVAVSVAPASAVPIFGQLNFTGTATVSATTVDWLPTGVAPPEAGEGSVETVNGTGYFSTIHLPVLGVNTADIIDLTPATVLPLANFLHQFVTPNPVYNDLSYTLQGLVIPALPVCTGAETVGQSCVAFLGSPFQLTVTTGPGGQPFTGVVFDVFGFFTDPTEPVGGTAFAEGSFTATVPGHPGAVRNTILAGGNVTAGFDAVFVAQPIPEPLSLSLLGTGLLGLAFRARRKKQ